MSISRRFDIFQGAHVLFHKTDLLSEFMREFYRFSCRERLPHFILGVDREHHLAVFPFLADHGFPSVFSR